MLVGLGLGLGFGLEPLHAQDAKPRHKRAAAAHPKAKKAQAAVAAPPKSKPKAEAAAPAPPPPSAAAHAARAADDEADVHKEGGTEVKTLEFTGLDIEGQLKTPQMLYFLNRLRAEFDRPRLPHRSFMPELSRSTQEKDF